MTSRAQTVTILFTDLVGSTELLQRAGDEQAQRIFKAHHRLLREAVESHGGHEVKWLGDGLMVAFDSTADAVKCAIAMQQASRRPTAGERLEIRAGLNVGEAFVDESDYFGTSVVIARRLCDSGGAGQIRASDIVVRLLDGRGDGIRTNDLGSLELKGITNPVPAVEIVYEHDPMALLRKLPFVGRQAEYEAMLKKLDEARNSRGAVILLAGEPGIGKTRLTEEFCDHASSGATVIRGNCYEGDVAAPFGPWTEALRSLLEQTPIADLRDVLGPGAPDIAVMLPEIRRRIPDLEVSPPLEPEAERGRLFDSINAWLRNTAEKKPLVIFLDDLHWCDRPSLALLEQIARGCADKRIVMAGTYRDVEVDRVHPLAQTLAALRRMEHHERIAIRGFTLDAVNHLLATIEPSESNSAGRQELAKVLHEESEGNPFFIREVLNNLVETGKLVQQDGVWVGTAASIEEMGIPEGIKEVVGRRLSRMSEICNRMLQRASAMTSGFTWDELRSICDASQEELLDALEEALGAQLIAERDRNTYAFTHALIRATLYDELSTPRRVQLHRRVAESLESLYAASLENHVEELAAHYMASTGSDAQKAIEYSIRAAEQAQRRYAWEDAAAHYQRALDAMAVANARDDERRCETMLALAGCHHHVGDEKAAGEFLRTAADIARRTGNADHLARAALDLHVVAYYSDENRGPQVRDLLDESLERIGADPSVLRVHLLCARLQAGGSVGTGAGGGFLFRWGGERDPADLALAREAIALAEQLGDDEAIWMACHTLLGCSWSPDNVLERQMLIERGYAAAERCGPAQSPGEHVSFKAMVLLERGDIEGFLETAAEIARIQARYRYAPFASMAASMHFAVIAARGRLAAAEETRDQYLSLIASPDGQMVAFGQLTFLRFIQGRGIELEAAWRSIVDGLPGVPPYEVSFAYMLAQAGRPEAEDRIRAVLAGGVSGIPRDYTWKATMYLLADACCDADYDAPATDMYDALVAYASANATIAQVYTYGSIARVVGRLATVLERYDEAERHFETALASNERQGLGAWVAWTRLNYADMLLRRDCPGDRERAIALLRQAHDFAKESGMGKVARDSVRLLATLA